MNSLKLTIIVPCYNGEQHLSRCLNSLLNQNLDPNECEILVINDGSTDKSRVIVENFIKSHKNIKLINQENKGLGATRNVGISLAKGDYIYFLDVDDYLAYNSLKIVLHYLLKLNLDILGFKTKVTAKLDEFSSANLHVTKDIEIVSGINFLLKNSSHRFEAWWYVLKRDFLVKSMFTFEEGKFMEDIVFTLQIIMAAKRFSFLSLDIHRYVKTPTSIMNNSEPKHLLKVVEDYESLITRIHCLKEREWNVIYKDEIKKHIEYIRTVNIYFMFFKIIKSSVSIRRINSILKKFEDINAYPFNNLIGEQYNHRKIKVSAYIFNKKYLFFTILYPLRLLLRLKLLQLPI